MSSETEKLQEELLEEMLKCQSNCEDIGGYRPSSSLKGLSKIEKMIEILPGYGYIRAQMLNYLFSNGLTTGSINEDVTLDKWVFSMNEQGATNYDTLREAIGDAAGYGECGVRWVDGSIYKYKSGTYGALLDRENGIQKIIGWYVHKKGHTVEDNIDLSDVETPQEIVRRFAEKDYILLSTDDFINIRNDTSAIHGDSPLLKDKLRLDLLVSVYERLNYDINYDGPGRIILRPRVGFGDSENQVSTTTLLNNSITMQQKNNEAAKKEIKRIGRELKESSSDSVIVISPAFSDQITHLERVTKATEFFDWIENEGVILAQAMGLSPSLLELGNISGNVSMEKIIDNSMMNNIVPLREKYAIQFSEFIARHIGVTKVYFDKYEMQQAEDENETRKRISEIMVNLARVNHFVDNMDQMSLIDELRDVIHTSLFDENNELKAMALERKENDRREIKYGYNKTETRTG